MVVALSSLRVGAEMDAGKYTAGMSEKVAADKEGAASSVAVGDALTATNTKISQSGDLLTRLRRQYVDGAANAQRFESAITTLGRGIERGAVPLSQVSSILDGIYKKYQLTADAALLMERGQVELAHAVETANAKLKQQNSIVPANQNTRSGPQTFQTANIAAQFQDVAVTAALGMNPLQIALQQGTQLSSVLATMGSGREVVGGLAAAFASLVSPVSLVTIGLTAAGAAAIQYFMSISGGSSKSEEALQKEIELIQKVADKWGDALPSLRKYAEERQRLADNKDILGAADAEADRQWSDLRVKVRDVRTDFADVVDQLRTIGADTSNVSQFQRDFGNLTDGITKGTAATKDVTAVQNDLATLLSTTGIPVVGTFSTTIAGLADAIATAAKNTRELKEEARFLANFGQSVLPALNGLTQPISDMGGLITDANDQQNYRAQQFDNANPTVLSNGVYIPVPTPEKRPNFELGYDGDGSERSAKSSNKAANAYRDLIKNANDRIQQMQLEAQTAGQTGIAAETLSFKLKLLQDATDKGRTVTAAQRAEIEKLADAYKAAATAAATAKLQQDIVFQQRQMGRSSLDQSVASQLQQYGLPEDLNSYEAQLIRSNEQLKISRDLAGDFASTLASGLRNGEGLWKSFGDAATSVLSKISDMLLNDVLNSLFRVNTAASSSGGGLLGSLGSLLGLGGSSAFPPAPTPSIGLFANGGVFSNSIVSRPTLFPFANGTGLMGEAGPEAIMPLRRDASGRLGVSAPSNDNRSAGSSGAGSVHVSVGVTFDPDDGFRAYVKDVAQTEGTAAAQDAVTQYDGQMPDRVAQINQHPRLR